MAGRTPRAYSNTVPMDGDRSVMEYVPFDRLGIGGRSSGLPKGDASPSGIKDIQHVGGSASGSRK